MNCGVIIVEGNIGAGKSTFASALAKALGGEYLPEPDESTNPYLEDYYRDPARWAFEMQMFLLTRRYRSQKYAQSMVRHKGGFAVLDRSYYGDVCFANVQKRMGYFSDRDYETYLQHHADMKVSLEPPETAVFLQASPCTCKKRIELRMSEKAGRMCEAHITLDYLNSLAKEIDDLADRLSGTTVVRVLEWDAPHDSSEITATAAVIAREIMRRPHHVYDFWTGTHGIGE